MTIAEFLNQKNHRATGASSVGFGQASPWTSTNGEVIEITSVLFKDKDNARINNGDVAVQLMGFDAKEVKASTEVALRKQSTATRKDGTSFEVFTLQRVGIREANPDNGFELS